MDYRAIFYKIFVSGNQYIALRNCSDVTGGHTVLDLWVSFHSFFFVSGNPYLALEYCSDVTEGHNLPFGGQNLRWTGGQISKSTVLVRIEVKH